MTFSSRQVLKFILVVQLLTGSLTAIASSPLDESLLGKYGPDRDAFLKLCGPLVKSERTNIKQDDVCFVYFIGVRNGYLTAAHKTTDKAALYYALDGKVAPGAELRSENWDKAFGSSAYAALEANKVTCVKEVPPMKLLQDFYAFLEKSSRNIGSTVLFDEFAQKHYAGKC